MNNLPENQNQEEMLKSFLALQQQEMAIRKDEVALRREEILSNERVGLASLEAQAKTDLKHADILVTLEKWKYCLWAIIAVLVCGLLVAAMAFNKMELAMRLLEIGGSVLLGYFAGFHRGKNKASEKSSSSDE